MADRVCRFCKGPIPQGRYATAVYCCDAHGGAFRRLVAAQRVLYRVLMGEQVGRFASPEVYARSNQVVARAAKVGKGRGGLRVPRRAEEESLAPNCVEAGHTTGSDARTGVRAQVRSSEGVVAA